MKVLITGAAGYIGSKLCGYLIARGHSVLAVDNLMYENGHSLASYVGDPLFEFVNQDVTQKDQMKKLLKKVDAIVPLAAIVGAPACDKMTATAAAVNHHAITTIVENASPNQRIVYPNTNSGYGVTDATGECKETDTLKPISMYGITKCEAESVVRSRANTVVFRLATVFGASARMRFDLLVNDFTHALCRLRFQRAYEPVPYLEIFEPHFMRNYVHVRDVCRAFAFALSGHVLADGVYNLGHPKANISKLQLAHKICDILGLSHSAVKIGEGRDPDQRNYLVSNAKILSTGFQLEHPLEQGINEVVELFRLLPREAMAKMRNA